MSQKYDAGSGAQAVSSWIFPKRFVTRSKQIVGRFARGVDGQMPPSPRQYGGQIEIDRVGAGIEHQTQGLVLAFMEKQFACLIHEDEQQALCLMFNAGAAPVDFSLPPALPGMRWHLAVDTSREAPLDLFAAGEEPLWEDPRTYHLSPRSSVVLLARGTNCQKRQTALTEAK